MTDTMTAEHAEDACAASGVEGTKGKHALCCIPAHLMSEGFCHCICQGSCVVLQRGDALCGLGYIVCQLLLLGSHILDCGCHAVQLGVLLGQ